jgi:hypothetical protein
LDRIRRHGYATDFGEMEEGVRRLTRVRLERLVFSIKRITAELSESLRASA